MSPQRPGRARPASDFVVYPCEACGKRVFTERAHLGQVACCPCCGAEHTVGASPTLEAQEGQERRQERRVPGGQAQVGLPSADPRAAALAGDDLFSVRDLSATGLSFELPGLPDPRRLGGERCRLAPGQRIQVTLTGPELFRPRALKAEVRRVVRGRRGFTVGVRFLGLSAEQQGELRALVRRLGERPR